MGDSPGIPITAYNITIRMTAHAAFCEPCAVAVAFIARRGFPDCLGALASILTGVSVRRRADIP